MYDGAKVSCGGQSHRVPSLKVDFQGSRVTSDGSLLLVRELDERFGLSALIHRQDHGRPTRREHAVADGQRGRREKESNTAVCLTPSTLSLQCCCFAR